MQSWMTTMQHTAPRTGPGVPHPEFLDEIHVCPLVFLHAALRNAGHISSQGAIDENTQHVQDSSEELAVGQSRKAKVTEESDKVPAITPNTISLLGVVPTARSTKHSSASHSDPPFGYMLPGVHTSVKCSITDQDWPPVHPFSLSEKQVQTQLSPAFLSASGKQSLLWVCWKSIRGH